MKIAIYSPNWIGDAVLALPFIQVIKEKNPKAEIIIICKEWVSDVYKNNPSISEIIPLANYQIKGFFSTLKTGRKLRNKKLDISYTLTDSIRSAFVLWLSNSKFRYGYADQMRSFLLTNAISQPRQKIHRSRKYLGLIDSDNYSFILPKINLSDTEITWAENELKNIGLDKPIALLPFSISKNRTLDNFLIKKWIEKSDRQYIIFGSKDDVKKADQLINYCQGVTIISICGEYSLRKSIQILSQCEYALAADSGLGHISAALGLPTLSFFGAGDSQVTAPIGENTGLIKHCSPCKGTYCNKSNKGRYCLTEISSSYIDYSLKNIIKS